MGHLQDDDVLSFPVVEQAGETENGFLILHIYSSKESFTDRQILFFRRRSGHAPEPADRFPRAGMQIFSA